MTYAQHRESTFLLPASPEVNQLHQYTKTDLINFLTNYKINIFKVTKLPQNFTPLQKLKLAFEMEQLDKRIEELRR